MRKQYMCISTSGSTFTLQEEEAPLMIASLVGTDLLRLPFFTPEYHLYPPLLTDLCLFDQSVASKPGCCF